MSTMSATAADPLQTSSTSSNTYAKAHSPKQPLLELRIRTSSVGLYPRPPTNITSDQHAYSAMTTSPPNSTYLFTCLLSGPLNDFLHYSGQEQSQWLIDIAHDICDPSLKRGSLQIYDDVGDKWRVVNPTDPLTTSNYYYIVEVVISLSKISERTGKSKTSASGNATIMANCVKQRDRQCWVTGMVIPITNSHICPKRMGDHLFRFIYSNFVSTPPPPALSIYDEICGIALSRILDDPFDTYELGLRFVAPVRRSSFFIF